MAETLVSKLEALEILNRHMAVCEDHELLMQLAAWKNKLTQWVGDDAKCQMTM